MNFPKHNPFLASVKQGLDEGQIAFVIQTPAERTAFYRACNDKGYNAMISQHPDPSKGKWIGYVSMDAFPKKAPPPRLFSETPIMSADGKPLQKFLQTSEDLYDESYPDDWYFYSKEHHLMVKPRESRSPITCLADLSIPVGTMTTDNTMVAVRKDGGMLDWRDTLARSIRSVIRDKSEIRDGIELAYEHLSNVGVNWDKTKYWRYCWQANKEYLAELKKES